MHTRLLVWVLGYAILWSQPALGCFTRRVQFQNNVDLPSMALMGDKIITAGGHLKNASVSNIIELYDTNTQQWSVSEFSMTHPRLNVQTAVVGSLLILFGGSEQVETMRPSRLVEYFDFENSISWSEELPHEFPSDSVRSLSSSTHAAFFLRTDTDSPVFIYDAVRNTSSIIYRRAYMAATTVDNDFYFVSDRWIDIYRTDTGTWTEYSLTVAILEDILDALVVGDDLYVISQKSIFIFYNKDVQSPTRILRSISYPYISHRVVYNRNLYIFVGASYRRINTILTIDGTTNREIAWDHEALNFGMQGSILAHKNLLYITGWNSGRTLGIASSILVYDLQNSRSAREMLPAGFSLQSMTVQNDKLLIASNDMAPPSVLIYDMPTRSLIQTKNFTNPRGHVHVTSTDGYVAFYGGQYTTRNHSLVIDLYDIAADEWSVILMPRTDCFATIHNGYILLYGDMRKYSTKLMDYYDIHNKIWRRITLSVEIDLAHVLTYNNKVVFLHETELQAIDMFDLTTHSLTSVPLRTPRILYSHLLHDNQLYIAGGIDDTRYLSSIEVYDVDNNMAFETQLELSNPRASMVAAGSGSIVVFAGGEQGQYLQTTVDIFNVTDNYQRKSSIIRRADILGLNPGIATIGEQMFLRTDSSFWTFDLRKGNQVVNPISTPFMAGGNIHAIGKNMLAMHGPQRIDGTFFFYDVTSHRFFQMRSPDYQARADASIVWRNFYVIFMHDLFFIELPIIFSTLQDEILHLGQTKTLSVNASGNGLQYHWQVNQRSEIVGANSSSLTLHAEKNLEQGLYFLQIQDYCGNLVYQNSWVSILKEPEFTQKMTNTTTFCNETVTKESFTERADTRKWILNGIELVHWRDNENIELNSSNLHCDSTNTLCVHASNPSGSVEDCASIHAVSMRIFTGPELVPPVLLRSIGTRVRFHIDINEPHCKSHAWIRNGVKREQIFSSSSDFDIVIEKDAEFIYVMALCDNARLNSTIFTLETTPVSDWGVALIIIGGAGAISLIVASIILVRKKFKRSKNQEKELKSMLNRAKKEIMNNKNGATIVQATTWEWLPTDDYTFVALDKFPVHVDTSNLGFSKSDPVDVGYWNQGAIVVSSKQKSTGSTFSISARLRQGLVEDPSVTVYVPKSPKFDIEVTPACFTVAEDSVVSLSISIMMKMTTKVLIPIIVVMEQKKIYSSIEFKIASKPSPWIDLDKVKVSSDILGSGSFGVVKKGTYKGQEVAVKMLLNQDMINEIKQDFEREVSVMKSLHHPNIVQFIGASNIAGKLALVTEFAPMGNLDSVIEKQLLTSDSIKVVILLEIARAIKFLHSNNVIHRDIKPLNVLVFSLDQRAPVHVKLSDFGTSKFMPDGSAKSMTKYTGTTKYMAPETLGYDPKFNKSADIFSFAVLVWEVMTGQSAYSDPKFDWPSKIEKFVMKGKRIEIPPDMDFRIAQLIQDCWHQDPEKRPSITTVIQQLSTFVYN